MHYYLIISVSCLSNNRYDFTRDQEYRQSSAFLDADPACNLIIDDALSRRTGFPSSSSSIRSVRLSIRVVVFSIM